MAHADAILDTIFVLGLVFLGLSFCTYAVQAALKAVVRLRGRHVRQGLESLCRVASPGQEPVAAPLSGEPKSEGSGARLMRWLVRWFEAPEPLGPPAAALLAALTEGLRQLDRIKLLRIGVLDRLSIASLALDRVPCDTLVPGTSAALQPACDSIAVAGIILASIDLRAVPPTGEPLISKVHEAFRGLSVTRSAFTGADGRVRADLATSDILQAPAFDAATIVAPLSALRALIQSDRRAKQPRRGQLDALAALLTDVTSKILDATGRLADARTQLQARVDKLRRTCDTVMTTVERRYGVAARRLIGAVSVAAVLLLDADVFRMYDSVARHELTRVEDQTIAAELLSREQRLQADERRVNQAGVAPPIQMASADPAEVLDINAAALSALASDRKGLLQRVRGEEHDLHDLTQQFAGVGFEAPTAMRLGRWWDGLRYRDYPDDGSSWFDRRVEDLKHLIGCVLSAMVLMTGTGLLRAVGKKLATVTGTPSAMGEKTSDVGLAH